MRSRSPRFYEGGERDVSLVRRQVRVGIDLLVMALVVVEDHLEHPARVLDLSRSQEPRPLARVVQQRRAVAVADALEVAVRRSSDVVSVSTVALLRLAQVDARSVFAPVAVEDRVALVVAGLADEPAEDPPGIARIRDPRLYP